MQKLFALPVWLMLSPFASAQCAGHDLRETLTSAERDRLDALLAEMPYPAGNHWRAEKDGEVIHLVGTMHLSDPRLEAPLERLRPVVRDAGALLLEMPRAQEKGHFPVWSPARPSRAWARCVKAWA